MKRLIIFIILLLSSFLILNCCDEGDIPFEEYIKSRQEDTIHYQKTNPEILP